MDERDVTPGFDTEEQVAWRRRGYGPQSWPWEVLIGMRAWTPWPHIRGMVLWRDLDTVRIAGDDGREYLVPYELVNPGPHFYRRGRYADRVRRGDQSIVALTVAGDGRGLVAFDEQGYALTEGDVQSLLEALAGTLVEMGPAEVIRDNWSTWLLSNPPPPALPMPKVGTPRPGVVYLLKADNGLYKIGKAKCLTTRVNQLGIIVPMEITLVHHFEADDHHVAETFIHSVYADDRVKGEWFRLDEEAVSWFCAITRFVNGKPIHSPDFRSTVE